MESTAGAPAASSSSIADHVQQTSTSAHASHNAQTHLGPSHGKAAANGKGAVHGKATVDEKGLAAGTSSSSTRGKKAKQRPAWALTADAAQEVQQEAEQQEEEDLLAFAGGLEFDKYINEQEDADLKSVLQVMLLGSPCNQLVCKARLPQ